jgi:hypothetical protein
MRAGFIIENGVERGRRPRANAKKQKQVCFGFAQHKLPRRFAQDDSFLSWDNRF